MNGSQETKSEIRARIDELKNFAKDLRLNNSDEQHFVQKDITNRLKELKRELKLAAEDSATSVIRSHKAICQVKQMDEKDAYGHDPAIFYTLGVCGEAGEMANAIVKAMRNGLDRQKILDAVCSELPDVIIYSYVLAYVLDIDLSRLVNAKADVVVQRAFDGYYGPPLVKDKNGT